MVTASFMDMLIGLLTIDKEAHVRAFVAIEMLADEPLLELSRDEQRMTEVLQSINLTRATDALEKARVVTADCSIDVVIQLSEYLTAYRILSDMQHLYPVNWSRHLFDLVPEFSEKNSENDARLAEWITSPKYGLTEKQVGIVLGALGLLYMPKTKLQ